MQNPQSLLGSLALSSADAPAHRNRETSAEVSLPVRIGELLGGSKDAGSDKSTLLNQLKSAKRSGDDAAIAKLTLRLAVSDENSGELESAGRRYEDFVRIAGEDQAAFALNAAATAAELAGDVHGAARLHAASIEASGDAMQSIVGRLNVARLLLKEGEATAAVSVISAAQSLAEEDGDRNLASVAAVLGSIAQVLAVANDVSKSSSDASSPSELARTMLAEAIATLMKVQARPVVLGDARTTAYTPSQLSDIITLRDRFRVLQAIALASHLNGDASKTAEASFESFVTARQLKAADVTRRAAVGLAISTAHLNMADKFRELAAKSIASKQ
jgi:hypothetical protein